MCKKYKDINEVLETSILDENLWQYDDLMREKPNFNKSPRR